jgi:hypothetical protein
MRGAIPPPSNVPSWRGDQLKKITGTTFLGGFFKFQSRFIIQLTHQKHIRMLLVFISLSKRRWEDNSEANLIEIGCDGVHWIQLAQDRIQLRGLLNTVMNPQVSLLTS